MTLLDAHAKLKATLLERLRALADVAGDVGMKTLRADLIDTRIPKLTDERFNLVVLGEFNHGKSSFVNALLGADVLPTGITPTTATINHVVFAEKPRAHAVMNDGTTTEIPAKKLADWVTVEGKHVKDVKYVEVGYPSELLREKVTLVDTPGVNDLNDQRAEITYGYVPRADAVIFLLDCGQALKESERAFLTSRVLERSRDRMIFVLGKVDLLDDKELADVTAYVRENLAKLVDDPPIFAVSARRQLAGDKAHSGMAALSAHLEKYLSTDRGRTILDNAAQDGLHTAAYLAQNLGVKRRTLELTVGELEERVGKVRAQLEATQKSLGALHVKIGAEAEAVKAQVRLDLEQFVARFENALPHEIDRVDAGDVKRYLAPYIQDKFKEWAEAEGEKVGALLERLAEEVITVTNENVRQATAALTERFGPGDARIDLDVDSFKYDVSVYAVGALGTTIFLFVNTLVGGLLTLAAPILAIVLQSRVAAEIKEHAKKNAPEALHKAADAVGPQFAKIVDEFGKRLSDFVTSAGDKLYKGITEVLDQALVERKTRGNEVAPLLAENEAARARVLAIESELQALHAELWA